MPKINEYVDNPNLFIRDLNKSIELHIKDVQAEKSLEWGERNTGSKVSGSIFSQCIRKAWYAYFTPPTDGEFGIDARKRMYLGYVNEEILLQAMQKDPNNIDVTIHFKQNDPPVNVSIEREGITLSSTTDFVLEYPGKIYVPMEVKSTESSDYKPANKWWPMFKGYDSHKRQILQWMYYAKANGWIVPFGVLFYSRRSNYDCKEFIFMDSQEVPFDPTGNSSIELYNDCIHVVEERIEELVKAINDKTIPSFPTDVPEWSCRSCQFQPDCWSNK